MKAEPRIDTEASAVPAAEQSTNSPEISRETYLGEVMLGLMESGRSVSVPQIVYALTLEKKISDGLFGDIMGEVSSLEAAGKVVRKDNGKYVSGESAVEANGDINTAPERPRAGSRKESRKSRKQAAIDKEVLDEKLRLAFGQPAEPRKGRRRRANPSRPKKRTPQSGGRVL